MKLEALNSSKFAAFKDDVVKNPLMVLGGRIDITHYQITGGATGNDTWRTERDVFQSSTAKYNSTWQEVGEYVIDPDSPIPTSGDTVTISDSHFSNNWVVVVP